MVKIYDQGISHSEYFITLMVKLCVRKNPAAYYYLESLVDKQDVFGTSLE